MNDKNIYQEIYNAAKKFLVPLDTHEAYMTVVKEAMALVNAVDGSIFMFEDGIAKRAYTTNKKLRKIVPRKGGITYEVYNTQLPRLRHREGLIDANPDFRILPYQSDISIPLNYGHITMGVLSVLSHRNKKFTDDDLGILTLFGPLATLALYNAQLHHKAQKAIETRDLFISMAAHELKNPLTLIKLNAQLLERSTNLKQLSEYKRVETILKGTERLNSLTDELLQVDRMRTGKLQYAMADVNIIDTVKQTVRDSRQRYTSHKFSLKNSTSKQKILVYADQDKLVQVFHNILNNAAKFSPEGSHIRTMLTADAEQVQVQIKDEGPGISAEVLPNLFTKFYRGNSNKEGMGLGLYLVKQIVTKHNGNIEVNSKLNSGTAVTISLPIYSHKKNNDKRQTRVEPR